MEAAAVLVGGAHIALNFKQTTWVVMADPQNETLSLNKAGLLNSAFV